MKVLIVANGDINDTQIITKFKQDAIIIACDGGLNYIFKEGLKPNYILGDLDSAYPHIIDFYKINNSSGEIKFIEFNPQKDQTDLELCIDLAISLIPTEIIILGGLGSRFDHSLTNVNLLLKCLIANIKASIVNENNTIGIISEISSYNNIFENSEVGDTISLIPLTTEVKGVTTSGLKYCLNDYTMEIGKSLGVSNVVVGKNPIVSIKSGYLIVVLARD